MEYLLGALIGMALILFYGAVSAKREQDERFRKMAEKFLEGQLQGKLTEAVGREDFEEAARIRDLINRK